MPSERITTSDGTEKYISFPKRRTEKEAFKKVFNNLLDLYVDMPEFDRLNTRVMLFILLNADSDNLMSESDSEIGRAVGVTRQCAWETIRRGLSLELWQMNISMRAGKRRIFVNPYLICRCGPTAREKLCKAWNEMMKGTASPFNKNLIDTEMEENQ